MKWGIIGLGAIAHKFASELLLEQEEVYAVASRNLEKAKEFAKQYHSSKYYDSYEELLKEENIDIVYIATPHHLHSELTIKALAHNKNVLCEKPFALEREQAQKMIELSKEKNKFLMEAFWTRFNPSILEILKKINDGEIGEIKYINADFAFPANFNLKNRLSELALGGGSLMDIGIYPIFLSYILLGKPLEILATSNFGETGIDLQTSIIFSYNKSQAVMHSGFEYHSNMEATICGTKGRIIIHSIWHMADSYTIVDNNGNKKNYTAPKKGIGYTHEIQECRKCIENNLLESKLWTHQNSLDLMELLDKTRDKIGLSFDQ